MTMFDVEGKAESQTALRGGNSLAVHVSLPVATTTAESGVFLAGITVQPQ